MAEGGFVLVSQLAYRTHYQATRSGRSHSPLCTLRISREKSVAASEIPNLGSCVLYSCKQIAFQ